MAPLALTPNTSLNLTRYGRRRKPGVCQFHHRHTPGLHRLSPRALYLERSAAEDADAIYGVLAAQH